LAAVLIEQVFSDASKSHRNPTDEARTSLEQFRFDIQEGFQIGAQVRFLGRIRACNLSATGRRNNLETPL
jgi:hypothetical protein